jgi:DNA polymerase I
MRIVYPSPLPRHSYIVRGTDGIQDVLDRLKRGVLAADTETTGLDWTVDRVGALCFAAGDTAAFFCKDALATAARWFADQVKGRRKLVFHNGKYDMHVIRETFGIHITYPVHDTLTMSRLLDNRGVPTDKYPFYSYSHELDTLAKFYVHQGASNAYHSLIDSIREAIAEETGDKRPHKNTMADWLMAPLRKAGEYGLRDPWYTLRLYDMFISMIQHWPQIPGYPSLMTLYKNERWLQLALRDMEERGVKINQDFLHEWLGKAQRRTDKLTDKMNRRAGYALNWNSNPQVRELFWDELELEQIDGEKLTKRVLLRMNHPFAALLLKRRKHAKEVSTGKAMLRNLDSRGLLHSHYNQNVDTGRMSAKKGVHQFARDSGVREAVVPSEDGLVLRSADYSQIEMRFAAHYSEEEILVEGFSSGEKFDTHAALASRMFGVKKPSDQQRDRGKTMNFAMLYGAGEDAVTEQLIDKISSREARQSCLELGYRPSRSESPFRSLAQLLRDAVRSSYPKVWEFTKEEEEITKMLGYVTDAYGYHRWLDDGEAYKAMNSKLQGSAAHKAKEGMVAVYRELQIGTGQLAIIMQVHDDVVYESDGDPEVDRRVLELLEDRKTFRVPMVADLKGSAKHWADKQTITLPKKKRRKVA